MPILSLYLYFIGVNDLPARTASAAIAIATTAAIATAPTASRTSSATSAPARTAAASATTALCFRPSFVDRNRAATQIASVQRFDGGGALRPIGHFHKTESPQTPAELISN
jgi:hypothetical protein